MNDAKELAQIIIDAWDDDKIKGTFWHEVVYKKAYPLLKKPLPEPDYWHVVDEDGNSIYSASFEQACHDHLNDALDSEEWESAEVNKWRVEGLYVRPTV